MIKTITSNTVKVCCGKKGCPVVKKLDELTYEVTDDFGNKIIISKDELKLMGDAVKTIENNEKLLLG